LLLGCVIEKSFQLSGIWHLVRLIIFVRPSNSRASNPVSKLVCYVVQQSFVLFFFAQIKPISLTKHLTDKPRNKEKIQISPSEL
jgi:hypothetical protein